MNKAMTKCKHCEEEAIASDFHGNETKESYLFKCSDDECGRFSWDKGVLQELGGREGSKILTIDEDILEKLKVPMNFSGKERNVYVIKLSRLRGEDFDSVYVGETFHHPLRRYLQHIRGYKSGRKVRERGEYLLDFEMGIPRSLAIDRERELGKELEEKGFKVKGPQE